MCEQTFEERLRAQLNPEGLRRATAVHRFGETPSTEDIAARVIAAYQLGASDEDVRKARAKCDGDHAMPTCSDPECWNRDDETDSGQRASRLS